MCRFELMWSTGFGAMDHRKRSFSSACSKDELQICVNLETPKEVGHGYQRVVDGDADVRTHDFHILEPWEWRFWMFWINLNYEAVSSFWPSEAWTSPTQLILNEGDSPLLKCHEWIRKKKFADSQAERLKRQLSTMQSGMSGMQDRREWQRSPAARYPRYIHWDCSWMIFYAADNNAVVVQSMQGAIVGAVHCNKLRWVGGASSLARSGTDVFPMACHLQKCSGASNRHLHRWQWAVPAEEKDHGDDLLLLTATEQGSEMPNHGTAAMFSYDKTFHTYLPESPESPDWSLLTRVSLAVRRWPCGGPDLLAIFALRPRWFLASCHGGPLGHGRHPSDTCLGC